MTAPTGRADRDVLAEITREIRWDPRIDQAAIEIRVQDGVVTLSGTVESASRKLAAYEKVLRVRGVRQIIDNIEVRLTPHPQDARHQAP